MKKKHKPYVKQGMPESGGPLYVSSWSALGEYIKHKPEDIERIECHERDLNRLKLLLGERAQEYTVSVGADELAVYIKTRVYGEIELEAAIGANQSALNVLALDHITDTRNLGAIIRSAAFFGVKHIIVPKKRQASIGHGTVKTCQGALSIVNLYEVTNLSRQLRQLKKDNFWILGADMAGESLGEYAQKFERNVLVLGSEDKGISRNVRETCDVIISIPGTGELDSLNVSVAAGIIMQQFSKSL